MGILVFGLFLSFGAPVGAVLLAGAIGSLPRGRSAILPVRCVDAELKGEKRNQQLDTAPEDQ